MIPVNELLRLFQRMNEEHWPYEWGAAQEGVVDCSGAFVWAYRQFGESIYHGSNRIARKYVVELLPISEAKPGMAAFKLREPGEEYYELPQGYMPGGAQYNGDMNDYHHIGLVDDDPRYVLNAKSTKDGFKRSPISEGWDCVACLKAVEYDEESEPMYEAVVIADSGSTVRMRKAPTTDSPTIVKVPLGEKVQVNESAQGWAQITYGGKTGYMMTKYLKEEEEDTPPMTLETRVALLEEMVAELQAIVYEGGVG